MSIQSLLVPACSLQSLGLVFAHSLSTVRTPQPYGLEAYKALPALSLALLVLLCSTRNGTRRHFGRIPPQGGTFSICRLFLNWAARLPCLPESSQKGLLLAISWRSKSFFFLSFLAQGTPRCTDVPFVHLSAIVKASNPLIRRFKHRPEGQSNIGTVKIQKNRRILAVRYSQIHNTRR